MECSNLGSSLDGRSVRGLASNIGEGHRCWWPIETWHDAAVVWCESIICAQPCVESREGHDSWRAFIYIAVLSPSNSPLQCYAVPCRQSGATPFPTPDHPQKKKKRKRERKRERKRQPGPCIPALCRGLRFHLLVRSNSLLWRRTALEAEAATSTPWRPVWPPFPSGTGLAAPYAGPGSWTLATPRAHA